VADAIGVLAATRAQVFRLGQTAEMHRHMVVGPVRWAGPTVN
jgi:hypothetical protein